MAWPGENGNHGMLLSSVSRYYGLNKTLGEPGNEQKLEDALKIMDFLSTEEGQEALASGSNNGIAYPFENFEITESSPLYEVKDYIEQGYTTELVYVGWEENLLVPIADELINWIQGSIDSEELLGRMDEINEQLKENPQANDYAQLDENLTQEQAARLCGIAMIEETDADVSLVSLGGITDDGNNLENPTGVQCGVFAEGMSEEIINIFRPFSSMLATVKLTGAEIQELADSGKELCADPDALGSEYTYLDEPVTYYMPYVLVVRDDAQLNPDQTYTVVFSGGDYSDTLAQSWGSNLKLIENADSKTALIDWMEKLPDGHFSSADLTWK
jgi:hypothetical protein